MNHCCLKRAAAIGFAVSLPTTVSAERVPIDDFSDSADDGWYHVSRSGVDATYEITNGEYVLATDATLLGPTGISAYWEQSADSVYTDGFLRARFRSETVDSNPILLMRVQDPNLAESWRFYGFVGAVSTGSLGILKFDSDNGGFPTAIVQETVPTGIRSDEDWILEAGAIGDELSLKAWRAGDPEPEQPQLVGRDSTFKTGGFAIDVGVAPGARAESLRGVFDDISFNIIPKCDFNHDGTCDIEDLRIEDSGLYSIGSLLVGTKRRPLVRKFDLTIDGSVNVDDLSQWLVEAATMHGYSGPYWPGDTNLDGVVDFEDFARLTDSFSLTDRDWSHGDFDGNLIVDFDDFLALAANFGARSNAVQSATVPEPAGIVLGLISCFCIASWGRSADTPR